MRTSAMRSANFPRTRSEASTWCHNRAYARAVYDTVSRRSKYSSQRHTLPTAWDMVVHDKFCFRIGTCAPIWTAFSSNDALSLSFCVFIGSSSSVDASFVCIAFKFHLTTSTALCNPNVQSENLGGLINSKFQIIFVKKSFLKLCLTLHCFKLQALKILVSPALGNSERQDGLNGCSALSNVDYRIIFWYLKISERLPQLTNSPGFRMPMLGFGVYKNYDTRPSVLEAFKAGYRYSSLVLGSLVN